VQAEASMGKSLIVDGNRYYHVLYHKETALDKRDFTITTDKV